MMLVKAEFFVKLKPVEESMKRKSTPYIGSVDIAFLIRPYDENEINHHVVNVYLVAQK